MGVDRLELIWVDRGVDRGCMRVLVEVLIGWV